MYFFGSIGLLLSVIGLAISVYLTVLWFQGIAIDNRPLFFLGILLIVVGMQSLSIGLISELIVNRTGDNEDKIKQIITQA